MANQKRKEQVLQNLNRIWESISSEEKQVINLLRTGLDLQKFSFEDIQVLTEKYEDLPPSKQQLDTIIFVLKYRDKFINLSIVWRYQEKELYGIWDMWVDGKRLSAFKTTGKNLDEEFNISNQEAQELFLILTDELHLYKVTSNSLF